MKMEARRLVLRLDRSTFIREDRLGFLKRPLLNESDDRSAQGPTVMEPSSISGQSRF